MTWTRRQNLLAGHDSWRRRANSVGRATRSAVHAVEGFRAAARAFRGRWPDGVSSVRTAPPGRALRVEKAFSFLAAAQLFNAARFTAPSSLMACASRVISPCSVAGGSFLAPSTAFLVRARLAQLRGELVEIDLPACSFSLSSPAARAGERPSPRSAAVLPPARAARRPPFDRVRAAARVVSQPRRDRRRVERCRTAGSGRPPAPR